MGTSETKAAHGFPGTLGVELSAGELVRALLGLGASRRLHLLDSGGARGEDARLLIAGFDPFEVVEARGEELRVWRRGEVEARVERGSVLALLDERLSRYRIPRATGGDVPLRGACVATLSYELARQFGGRVAGAFVNRPGAEPDAVLAFFDVLVVHDYARGVSKVVGVGGSEGRMREARETLLRAAEGTRAGVDERTAVSPPQSLDEVRAEAFETPPAVSKASSDMTRAEYVAAVERVRGHIYAGDIYQANLTQQITCALPQGESPERVFLRLREEHPASFAAFVRRGSSVVVSASPERFLRVSFEGRAGEPAERVVEAWPIKGTRRRGADAEEDARLRAELLASGKDAAENVMIVDLTRNDLGRVCLYGSVEVTELCALQEHPTLFHLVSKVRGVLRGGVTAGDLLRAAFPCGSITGAPKIRAMEIISEVERGPRGVSMGAVGYFSFDGAADLSVAIRTVTFDAGGAARFNVGGGVVAESEAESEYEESLLKARALLRALRAEL